MKLKEILSVLPFYETTAVIDHVNIDMIEMDSRKIEQGSLFICVEGFTVDGHDFIDQAVENGASAILAQKEVETEIPVVIVPDTSRAMALVAAKFYDYPTTKMPVIGVTGTNGKTTITYILEAIFKQMKKKTGIIGTIQMKIGEEIFPIVNTTPDALFLQKAFKQMVDEHVNIGIMEVSSHALDMGRVHGSDFDIAIFTNLSQDHLDYHKNMDDYLRAKSLLFAQLGNTYNKDKKKFAIINEDDKSANLLKKSTAQPYLTYGCRNKAQVMATNIELDAAGTRFTLNTPFGNIPVKSRLIGMFNVYNMLAAASAALVSNVALSVIKQALAAMKGVSGRFEPVDRGQSFAAIVDYAHTPDSLENVLETIKGFAKRKVFVVVGCGGDRDKTKRPLMAEVALKYADHAIFTSDNPRTEDPIAILDDMTKNASKTNFEVITNRKKAIHRAVQYAEKDDIVLVAGKGHETYQQIGLIKHDFDDREVVKEAIANEGNA